MTKKCNCCGEDKLLSSFHKKSEAKDGHNHKCTDCVKSYNRKIALEKVMKGSDCNMCGEALTPENISASNFYYCAPCFSLYNKEMVRFRNEMKLERGSLKEHGQRLCYFVNKVERNDMNLTVADVSELITLSMHEFFNIGTNDLYTAWTKIKRASEKYKVEKRKIRIKPCLKS